MTRATKAKKARLLNAAYRLLEQQLEVAEAAQSLGRKFALSRRQAYRYLEEAAGLSAPVPAVEPTVAVTFKLPDEHRPGAARVCAAQWAHPRADCHPGADGVSGRRPPATWVSSTPRGGLRQVHLDYVFDRLRTSKLAHAYGMLVPARARRARSPEKGASACRWRRCTPGYPRTNSARRTRLRARRRR